jgi:S1-C subfamily serine protease
MFDAENKPHWKSFRRVETLCVVALLCALSSASALSQGNVVVGGELQTRADSGDPKAAYALGMRYFMGEHIVRNREMAMQYLTRAAEGGDLRAMNMLGLMFDPLWSDEAKAKDLPTAVNWYRRAAMQGYEPALANLSELKKRGYIKSELENGLALAGGSGQAQVAAPPNTSAGVPVSGGSAGSPAPVLNSSPATPASAQAPISNTALNFPGASGAASLPPAAPLAAPMDGREMFKSRSSALVEILGDGQYGSGVILGTLWMRPEDATLRTALQDLMVSYPFMASPNTAVEATVLPTGSYLVVVSNAHVMEGTRQMEIGYGVDPRGQTVFKKPIAGVCFPSETNVDLAIFFVPVDSNELALNGVISSAPLPPAAVSPEPGSRIYAIANPERMTRTIAQGLLSGLRPDLLQFDAPISKGSSGGALFDESGHLLGVILGYLNEIGAQNLNFAIPAERIRPLMMGSGALCYRASPPDSNAGHSAGASSPAPGSAKNSSQNAPSSTQPAEPGKLQGTP